MPSQMALTKRWKGALSRSKFVPFWYLLISLRATVPGLKRLLLVVLTPPSAGAVFFLATLEALEALDPVATLDLEAAALSFFPTTFYLGIVEVKFEI